MRTTKHILFLSALLAATPVITLEAKAGTPVWVAAEVTRPENNAAPVTITVTNAAGDTLWTRTSRTPRFTVRLPEDEQYVLSFEQPHSVRKEVLIDAHHALRPGSNSKLRKVSFEVVLDLDPNADMRYARPVGQIDFHKGSGHLRVSHDYALVTAGRR